MDNRILVDKFIDQINIFRFTRKESNRLHRIYLDNIDEENNLKEKMIETGNKFKIYIRCDNIDDMIKMFEMAYAKGMEKNNNESIGGAGGSGGIERSSGERVSRRVSEVMGVNGN